MRILLLSLMAGGCLTVPSAAEGVPRNFLPLQTGNEWILRSPALEEDVRIAVGLPLWRRGFTYYHVTGYAAVPLWVRQAADGGLWYIDPGTDEEQPLTPFGAEPGATQRSGLRQDCLLEVRPEAIPVEYSPTPGASPAAALVMTYQSSGCESPVEEERYVENLGMVYRRVATPHGPAELTLTWARIGALDFNPTPNRTFQLALDQTHFSRERPDRKFVVSGHLRISGTPYLTPVRLRFPNLKRIEIVLRDSDGQIVYRHTDDQSELPIGRTVMVGTSWSIPFQFLFADRQGATLPDGTYTMTAWLNTGDPEPQFTAQTVIQVASLGPATGE